MGPERAGAHAKCVGVYKQGQEPNSALLFLVQIQESEQGLASMPSEILPHLQLVSQLHQNYKIVAKDFSFEPRARMNVDIYTL